MVGSQGLYRVMNEAKNRTWNAYQWKQRAVRPQSDAPDVLADEKKGDRSERTTVSSMKRRRAASTAAGSDAASKSPNKKRAGGGEDADGAEEEADAEADVEDDGVWVERPSTGDGCGSGVGDLYLEPVAAQVTRDHVRQRRLVVDHQSTKTDGSGSSEHVFMMHRNTA